MGGVTKNAELLFARVGSVPRVILGQNCVWLSDAALDDSFVLWKAVQICYEHKGCSNQSFPVIVFYG